MSTKPADQNIFSTRVAIALFVVGVFSFSAFITLSAFAPELTDGNDAQAHALSRSAIGYSGFVKLLKSLDKNVTISRTEFPEDARNRFLTILTPRSQLKEPELNRLTGWRTLVVLPKWATTYSSKRRGWVGVPVMHPEDHVEDIVQELTKDIRIQRGTAKARLRAKALPDEEKFLHGSLSVATGEIESPQTLQSKAIIPVLQTSQGQTLLGVLRHEGWGDIYILSDPDLLNNHGIADKDTAESGYAIINALNAEGDPVSFDVTLNGFLRSRSLLRLAFEPPLLALTLSLVFVSAFIAWRAAVRDGPAQAQGRKFAFGKQILANNSAALLRLAGREHRMARKYADAVRANVAVHLGLKQDDIPELVTVLDKISAQKKLKHAFSELAANAENAAGPLAALVAARNLRDWKLEILRATR